jgi:hypothetical protein
LVAAKEMDAVLSRKISQEAEKFVNAKDDNERAIIEASISNENIERFLNAVADLETDPTKKKQIKEQLRKIEEIRGLKEMVEDMKSKMNELQSLKTNFNSHLDTVRSSDQAMTGELAELKSKIEQANRNMADAVDPSKLKDSFDQMKLINEQLLEVVSKNFQQQHQPTQQRERAEPACQKLSSLTPVFKGNSDEDVDKWIYGIEADMRQMKMQAENRVMALNYFVKNQAFYVWRELVETQRVSDWEIFKEKFRAQFRMNNKALVYREKLAELRQKGTVSEYNDSFFELKSNAGEMSDIEALTYYIKGLNRDIQMVVRSRGPNCLIDAMREASTLDSMNKSETRINYVKSINKPKYNGSNNFNSNASTDKKCYNCNRPGHLARDCRAPKQANNKFNNNNKFNKFNKDKPDRNGKPFQASVAHVMASKTVRIKTTKIKINDIEFSAFLDSAAETSIMSEQKAKECGFRLKASPMKIKNVNDGINGVIGETEELLVIVHGIACKLVFAVIKHEDDSVILGLDWFNETDAVYGPSQNKLIFHGKAVYLDNDFENRITALPIQIDEVTTDVEIDQENNIDDELGFDTEKHTREPPVFGVELPTEWKKKLTDAIMERSAFDMTDLEQSNVDPMHIQLIDKTPVFRRAYRKSKKEEEIIEEEVQKLLKANIIRPSNSAYSSPILLVKKSSGEWRVVIDFRELNKVIVDVRYPPMTIAEMLDELAGSVFMTTMDFKSGFFQCKLAEEDKHVTAFCTPSGQYEFNVVPQGIKTAPAHFQSVIARILRKCKSAKNYVDDVVITGKTLKEHFKNVMTCLEIFKEAGFKINPKKCDFFQTKLKILGYIVDGENISIDPSRIEAIKNRPDPKNHKDVERIVGLYRYYSKFIDKAAEKIDCLQTLATSKEPFVWTPECAISNDYFKTCLSSEPILAQPNLGEPFILYSDASNVQIGGMLCQKLDGTERVIAYASRALHGAEKNYGISDKECLAAVWMVKKFRVYLDGAHFTLITDHAALLYLMSIKDYHGRLARWALFLQQFSFDIVYKKGKDHINADALSRPPAVNEVRAHNDDMNLAVYMIRHDNVEDQELKNCDPYDNKALIHLLNTGRYQDGASRNQIRRLQRLVIHFTIRDGVLFYRKNANEAYTLKYPKKEERRSIILREHEFGHFGVESTYNRIKNEYFWRRMIQDIELVVKLCYPCQRNNSFPTLSHPARAMSVMGVFDTVALDYVFGLEQVPGSYRGFCLATDVCSNLIQIWPVYDKSEKTTAACVWDWIRLHGPPKRILSDQGKEFTNNTLKQLLERLNIYQSNTSSYTPSSNGDTERRNATVTNMIAKICEKDTTKWHEALGYVELAYNSRVNSSTGYSPYEVVHGFKMNSFSNWKELEKEQIEEALARRALEIKRLHEEIRPNALINIQKNQEKQIEVQNERSNVVAALEIGTPVRLRTQGLRGKLENRYRGKYYVHEIKSGGNYILRSVTGEILKESYPIAKLRPIPAEPEDDQVEVEKILDHRMVNNKYEFFVKWKNLSELENEWIKEDDFGTVEIINDYWKLIHRKDQPEQTAPIEPRPTRGRGRPPKISILNVLTLLFILMLGVVDGQTTLKGKFRYCTTETTTLMDEESCYSLHDKPFDTINGKYSNKSYNVWTAGNSDNLHLNKSTDKTFTILSKLNKQVSGIGFKCKREQIIGYWNSYFFTGREPPVFVFKSIFVSAEECKMMVENKICSLVDKKPMECDSLNSCVLQVDPPESYIWPRKVESTGYKCQFYKVAIEANIGEKLFNEKCEAKDLKCFLSDSTVIWDKNIIHHCPFVAHKSVEDFEWVTDSIISSASEKIALQLTGQTLACENVIHYLTAEGFYLTKYKHKINEKTELVPLILADTDYTKVDNAKIFEELNRRNCYQTLNMIRLYKNHRDEFFKIRDINDSELILYSNYGQIFIPNCVVVDEIKVFNHSSNCFADIPVSFNFENNNYTGFLQNGIIRRLGNTVNCELERIETVGTHVIHQKGQHRTVLSKRFRTEQVAIMNRNLSRLNLAHNSELVESYAMLRDNNQIEIKNEEHGRVYVKRDVPKINDDFLLEIKTAISNYWSRTKIRIIIISASIFALILFIILTIIIIKISLCCLKYNLCCLCRRKNKKEKKATRVNVIKTETPLRRSASTSRLDEATRRLLNRLEI